MHVLIRDVFQTLNFKALAAAGLATFVLICTVIVGSRNLQNFDGALIPYLFGTIFAAFGITYRYAAWLQRPPTWRYFIRGWQLFFSRRFLIYGFELVRHFLADFVCQRFIFNRGRKRWAGHLLMVGGCLLAFAVTVPLTFGWIYFGLKQGTINVYEAYTFGFKTFEFPLDSWIAENTFHVLNWCSLAVIIGVGTIIRRRLTNAGLIAVQTFEGDWLPLLLLLAISITGLGLTLDYEYLQGKAHQFMAITHAITVILFLIWMPFGKFFHIFQRPAQLGIAIYRSQGRLGEQAICKHNGEAFASKLHIDDLKEVTAELGFDYRLKNGGSHLDLSPQGKRAALATAHLNARKKSGAYFG